MDRKIAGLLGAVAALGTVSAAQAAPTPRVPTEPLRANSFAELLQPIPNAVSVLKTVDESQSAPSAEGNVQLAQYHHHHHHHHFWRRYRHHHHHHHHFWRRHY